MRHTPSAISQGWQTRIHAPRRCILQASRACGSTLNTILATHRACKQTNRTSGTKHCARACQHSLEALAAMAAACMRGNARRNGRCRQRVSGRPLTHRAERAFGDGAVATAQVRRVVDGDATRPADGDLDETPAPAVDEEPETCGTSELSNNHERTEQRGGTSPAPPAWLATERHGLARARHGLARQVRETLSDRAHLHPGRGTSRAHERAKTLLRHARGE